MLVRCCVECLGGGDGGDGKVYDGSDEGGLLAFGCKKGGSEALGDAFDEHEDADGGQDDEGECPRAGEGEAEAAEASR